MFLRLTIKVSYSDRTIDTLLNMDTVERVEKSSGSEDAFIIMKQREKDGMTLNILYPVEKYCEIVAAIMTNQGTRQ